MSKYIDTDKLKAEIKRRIGLAAQKADIFYSVDDAENEKKYDDERNILERLLELVTSLQQEQPEVDIVPLQEEKMVCYINYCLQREDDDCNCPNCGKYVTGLRLFPYYYDRENNDVYFASVCPECGKIIISKE